MNSINNNINNATQAYSMVQENNYDNISKSNVWTTKFKIEDIKLENLSPAQKEDLEQQLLKLAKELNKEMQEINTNIMFDYEDSISSLVLTIKQKDSGEIIRQIPTDEAMELMKKMRDIISVILDTRG
ncbi:flagellar protein FlaG [Helicobacter sp. MIT 14-3879]|uniref:flagellar protein FlaG n=1 Tax=Helicobacter sp. MIT 14-3879 TaxID=2040649 RepID=UPI000E1FB4D9|nr:flagellar protein FlaG [Helicobacter sp. MIT 14-3879]RDU64732.1 flagellar biosynthesis protein FlaG [Helicobacter sp. MIT 14-3879]